jgi:hypothetical protein
MQVNENTKDSQRYTRCCRVRQPRMFVFAASDGRTTSHECLHIVDFRLSLQDDCQEPDWTPTLTIQKIHGIHGDLFLLRIIFQGGYILYRSRTGVSRCLLRNEAPWWILRRGLYSYGDFLLLLQSQCTHDYDRTQVQMCAPTSMIQR